MKYSVIGKNAVIGKNVCIGNFTTIEEDVVIGDNTWIGNNVNILDGTRIGENCQIHSGATLGGNPQDLKYRNEYSLLEIGSNTVIREFVTINKGTASKGKTIVGNNNLLMSHAHIGHDCLIGDNCIIGFSVGIAGEVIIKDWVNISGLSAIHQFSVIGEHAMISGMSKIVKDIPPYITAGRDPLQFVSINAIGLRRRNFDVNKINELRAIYHIIFQEKRNTTLSLNYIEATLERDQILNFIRESKRGIIKGYHEKSI